MTRIHFRLATLVLASCLAACQCANNAVKNKPKAEGEVCANDDECETLLCDKVPPGKDKVCVRKCAAGCKDTEICSPLDLNDRYACVPNVSGLCQPCQLSSDCPYPADRCVQLGGAMVCAR